MTSPIAVVSLNKKTRQQGSIKIKVILMFTAMVAFFLFEGSLVEKYS